MQFGNGVELANNSFLHCPSFYDQKKKTICEKQIILTKPSSQKIRILILKLSYLENKLSATMRIIFFQQKDSRVFFFKTQISNE